MICWYEEIGGRHEAEALLLHVCFYIRTRRTKAQVPSYYSLRSAGVHCIEGFDFAMSWVRRVHPLPEPRKSRT